MRGEPVFHVSGPRITREDFKTFAGAAERGGAPLRWLLYFVGSGEIGHDLVAKNQEVFASENATRFAGDPIGLDLVIEAWKKQPGASLEALARSAGPAIAERYTSRSLARTEEPTFFADGQPPVLLAELDPEKAAPPEKSEAALPEKWRAIHRVDPKDFPKADAVILSQSSHYTLGENPAIDDEVEEYTQILTAEGKRHGDIELSFSPPDEDLVFLALEVLTPDDKLQTFDPENVLDEKNNAVQGYEAGKRKMFSLPKVQPGAIIHAHYRRVWKRFPFPHVFLSVPIGDDIPVRQSTIQVEATKTQELHYQITNAAAVEPVSTESSYGRTLKWEWKDLPAFSDELLAEPGGVPELRISTFPDWKSFDDWYQRLIREADTITDEIRKKTDEVTTGLKTPQEKVKALYEFVAGMRYVSVPLGVNSFRPHAADNVLRNNYGDCKDKANLLNTMLRAAGFQAQLVLVPRFSQADPSVPGLAFNHAISRVELPEGPMWLDSTDDVCPFGMLPPGDSGRNVLVVGGEDKLARLPDPNPADHRIDLEFSVDLQNQLAAKANLSARGFAGYHLRTSSRQIDQKNGTLPLLSAAGLVFTSGILVTEHESHTSASQLDGDFKWQADGRWTGLATMAPGRKDQLISAPFVIPESWKLSLQARTRELFFDSGYPLVLKEVIRFRKGNRPAQAALPPLSEETEGPLRWRLAWKQDESTITADLQVELPKGRIDGAQVARFQRDFARLGEALATPVSIPKEP